MSEKCLGLKRITGGAIKIKLGGARKNHMGCKEKITGGARILQGMHEKNFGALRARRKSCNLGQMSMSAPDVVDCSSAFATLTSGGSLTASIAW